MAQMSRTGPLAHSPEMGCNTAAPGDVSFSFRLPENLRGRIRDEANIRRLSASEYVRSIIEAHLSGKRPRRRRGKYDALRADLAQIHAAIIACGNQIADTRCVRGPDQAHRPDDASCCIDQENILHFLKETVSALLLLAKSVRDG